MAAPKTSLRPKNRPDFSKTRVIKTFVEGEDGTKIDLTDYYNPILSLGLSHGRKFREMKTPLSALGAYLPPYKDKGVEVIGGTTDSKVNKFYQEEKPNSPPIKIHDVVLIDSQGSEVAAHEYMHKGFETLRNAYSTEELEKLIGKMETRILKRKDFEHFLVQAILEKEYGSTDNKYLERAGLTAESIKKVRRTADSLYDISNKKLKDMGFYVEKPHGKPFKRAEKESFLSGILKKFGFSEGGDVNQQTENDIKNYITKQRFAQGGLTMNEQTEMAFMQQGGLKDDGMKQDPVSGNPIPNGSMAEEVRDDIPAQLSEGEYVVPADVVRYYGVKHFEDIRNKAKSGLQSMEANGRIGGEPVPVGGPKAGMQQPQQMAGDLNQDEMNEIQSMMMAVGGFVEEPNNMQQGSADPYQQQQTMYKQPMAMGAFNGTDVSGFGFTPAEAAVSTPSPQAGDGSFSVDPRLSNPGQGLFSSDPNKNTIVILYSPDGLITRSLNLPADKIEYDNLIAQGYVTTKPTVAKESSGGRRGGSGGTPGGNSPIVDKDWGKGVDWTKPGEYADKIYNSVKDLNNMAGAGFAGASLLGASGIGIAIGVGAKFKIGAAVSDLHAAAIIAEARGLPDEVKRINDMADSLIKSGGGLLQFANYFGMMSGVGNAKNRLDEDGYQYGKDDDGSPIFNSAQIKYNSNLGSKPKPAATVTDAPKPTVDGPTAAQKRFAAKQKAERKARIDSASDNLDKATGPGGESTVRKDAAAVAGAPITFRKSESEQGFTGGFNKGGLMTSKKKKKKTKGK